MKRHLTVALAVAGLAAATTAQAQSSVTLYGIIDTGLAYQSSGGSLGQTSGGHSAVKMSTGVTAGSRVGLRGVEDLGGGTQAVFTLEAGISSADGSAQFPGGMFTRQAFVGLSNANYGTLTAGRQYTAYYQLLAPWSPTTWLTGYFGAHPGDIDSLDTSYRANNSVVYLSPKYHGFSFGGSYAFGGEPGSVNAGSTWSAGLQYANGPLGVAAAFMRVNNSTPGGGVWGANSTAANGGAQPSVSAINNGYVSAQAQQRVAVTAGYQLSSQWDVTASYSNVQYIPGSGSTFRNTAIFNTGGAALHYRPVAVLDLAAAYSYTRATLANGVEHAARYHQITLSQVYSLSKRTGLYAIEAYQHAGGSTLLDGRVIAATASIGDGFNAMPATTSSQVGIGVGMVHRF